MHAVDAHPRREAPFKRDENVATKYEEPTIFQNNELSIFTLFTFFHVFHVNRIGCNRYCSCNNDTNGIDLPLILNIVHLQTFSRYHAQSESFRHM
jgi:hypothetical protein